MTHSPTTSRRIKPALRTSNLWLLGAAAAVALTGCDLGAADSISSNNEAPTFDEFLTQTYLEPWEGGVYIVNGDTAIGNTKKLQEFHAQLYGNAGALIVHRNGNADAAWNSTERKNLTYCVSNQFGAKVFVKTPYGDGPDWGLRYTFTLLFPK